MAETIFARERSARSAWKVPANERAVITVRPKSTLVLFGLDSLRTVHLAKSPLVKRPRYYRRANQLANTCSAYDSPGCHAYSPVGSGCRATGSMPARRRRDLRIAPYTARSDQSTP